VELCIAEPSTLELRLVKQSALKLRPVSDAP
jgi:hypothetical protein